MGQVNRCARYRDLEIHLSFSNRGLEIMLKQIAIHNAERYAEYLSQQTGLATKLKGLLRDEALAVFEVGEFDREQ